MLTLLSLSLLTVAIYATCDPSETDGCQSQVINTSTLYCQGLKACWLSTIYTTTATYCDGAYGCTQTTQYPDGTTFCKGQMACYGSVIRPQQGGNVYCDGADACYLSIIVTDGDLICDGDRSCIINTGSKVGGDLYCNGYYSCYTTGMTFTSSGNIYVDGELGLASNTLYLDDDITSRSITVYGYRAMYFSKVYSGQDNTLSINGVGFQAYYNTYFYCESGSTCSIVCQYQTCLYTRLYCDDNATCSINCDYAFNSVFCATEYSWNSAKLDKKTLKIENEKLSKKQLEEVKNNELPQPQENIVKKRKHNDYQLEAAQFATGKFNPIKNGIKNNQNQKINVKLISGIFGFMVISGIIYYIYNAKNKKIDSSVNHQTQYQTINL